MPITRAEKKNYFTIISNYAINDSRLGNDTLGLFLRMLAKPNTWQFTVENLSKECGCSRYAIQKSLNELQEFHYLKIDHFRKGGRFCTEYTVFEIPSECCLTEDGYLWSEDLQDEIPFTHSGALKETFKISKYVKALGKFIFANGDFFGTYSDLLNFLPSECRTSENELGRILRKIENDLAVRYDIYMEFFRTNKERSVHLFKKECENNSEEENIAAVDTDLFESPVLQDAYEIQPKENNILVKNDDAESRAICMRDNTAIDSPRRGDNKSNKEIENKNVDIIIVTGSNRNKVYDELKCNNVIIDNNANNIRRDNISHNDRNIQIEIFKQKWIKRLEERMSNQRMKKILFRKGLDAFLLHMAPSEDDVDLFLDCLDSKLDEWKKLGYIPMQELMQPLKFP